MSKKIPNSESIDFQKEISDLKNQIGELSEIKRQFDLLVNNTDDLLWVLDQDLKFTYISPSVQHILGYDDTKFLDGSFLDLCHPDSKQTILNAYNNRINGTSNNEPKQFEVAFLNLQNEIVWLDTITKPILDDNNIFIGLTAVSRNITQKRKAEQKSKENKANLVAQIENTTDSIWSIDKNFNILTLNSNFKRNFDLAFSCDLQEGTNIVEALPGELSLLWKERYLKALSGEIFKATDHYKYQNVPQYVEVSFNPIWVDEKIIGVACFSHDTTNIVLNEIALKESETRFKTLVSNLPSVAFRCKVDETWSMEFISKEIANLSGYEPEDFISNKNLSFVSIILEKDRENVSTVILNAVKNTMSYSVEYRIIHRDGSIRWVHERGRGNYNEFNEVEWLDGVISDVTGRKTAEEAMASSEQKFRSIFDNTISYIAIQNDEKIFLVNKAWERITGYTAEEANFIDPIDLAHPQDKVYLKDISNKIISGKDAPENYHYHLIDKNGHEKWLDMSVTVIEFEGQKATLVIGSEITERKMADLEIKKLSTGIINSPLSIVITDIEGSIEYANPFFCEFTGYALDEVIGKNPNILKSGTNDPEIYKDLWKTIISGNVWNGSLENKKKDGSIYWESARIAPILDENGIIISFIAIKEDITEQKRYHEMIEQSEKDLRDLNAKKDKFFSIIAHDLRSPLVGLVGLTDLLKDNFKELTEEKLAVYLKFANEASHNLFKLLENLLEWSKSQTDRVEFKPEPLDISELIQDAFGVAQITAQNKDITLVNFTFSEAKVSADKNMVFTVLRNLISNAIKYTPRNGRIEVDAKQKDRHLVISVKDSGIGIEEKHQKNLFRIDKTISTKGTEKEQGSGLGLIICKEFIEKHGCDIWCKSEVGNGSTFKFTLPLLKNH